MSTPQLHIQSETETLIAKCALFLSQSAQQAIQQRGRFTIALCGGNSPKPLFSHWARTSPLPWKHLYLFWGDERCVPPDDPQSNFRMATEHLLANLPPEQHPQIFRIHGERPQPSLAATHYDRLLRKILGPQGKIDVVLLGIGTDGHTASLFPHQTPALEEQKLWCKATINPNHDIPRITLTYPLLTQARQRVFFVPGNDKFSILRQLLLSPSQPQQWPAQPLLTLPHTHLFTNTSPL